MPESHFALTLRQSIRILVELLVLGVLVMLGVDTASHLLRRYALLPPATGDAWEGIIGIMLGCAWVVWRTLRRHRLSWSSLGVVRIQPGGLISPFLVMVIGIGILLSAVDNIVEAIAPTPTFIREVFLEFTDPGGQPFAGFIAVTLVAPITEEVVCRGILLRGLLGRYDPRRAIILSALLFAVMHVNPWQMPSAFGAGLILGWAYLRTRSLGLCIAGHALHNAIYYFTASLPFEIPGFNTIPLAGQNVFQPWWLDLIGLFLFVIGAVWFHRSAPPPRSFLPEHPEDSRELPSASTVTIS